jgi:hypothetical protein
VCCQPDHIGPPPEWHRDHDDRCLPDYPRAAAVPPAALALRLWDACGLTAPEPGPRPVSTEDGHGRALPQNLLHRHLRYADMRAELAGYDPGGGLEHPDPGCRPTRRTQ